MGQVGRRSEFADGRHFDAGDMGETLAGLAMDGALVKAEMEERCHEREILFENFDGGGQAPLVSRKVVSEGSGMRKKSG